MTESVAGLRKAIGTYSTPFGAFRNGLAPKSLKYPSIHSLRGSPARLPEADQGRKRPDGYRDIMVLHTGGNGERSAPVRSGSVRDRWRMPTRVAMTRRLSGLPLL